MTHSYNNGRAPSLSMADFNARAKSIAASTGAVEKRELRRPSPTRFRRDARTAPVAAAKPAETSES